MYRMSAVDESERAEILRLLAETRDAFLATVEGISEAQARYKPAEDRWSILECAEHVAVSEHGMYRLITKYWEASAEPAGREGEAIILEKGVDRTLPQVAPEIARPRGRFATFAEAVERFRQNRMRTTEFVEQCRDDLRARTTLHPFAGKITCQECLLLLAVHPGRHALQIRELRAAPGFPVV